jgi:hypothetical protein
MSRFLIWRGAAVAVLVVLTACTQRGGALAGKSSSVAAQQTPVVQMCETQANSPLVGKWYSTSTPRGVGGQMHTLVTLRADGSMIYDTQLKIGQRMRPGLRESGCWTYAGNILMLHTLRSNGEEIDANDPIYQNRWRVESVNASRLTARDQRELGQAVTARKMPDTFKLPTK